MNHKNRQRCIAYVVILIFLILTSIIVAIIVPNVRKRKVLRSINELNDHIQTCFTSGMSCLIDGDCCSGSCCMNECVLGNDCYLSYGDECIRYPTHCNSDKDLTCQNGVCLDCKSANDYCGYSSECCSGLTCQNGNCLYKNSCNENGYQCSDNNDCCSNNCCMNKCVPDDYTYCYLSYGDECDKFPTYCNKNDGLTCQNGYCSQCKSTNDYCTDSSQCCSGYCQYGNNIENGIYAYRCA